jgi:hypothetical protein
MTVLSRTSCSGARVVAEAPLISSLSLFLPPSLRLIAYATSVFDFFIYASISHY